MANPTSQTIAEWVIENLTDGHWVLLSEICYLALQNKLISCSEDEIDDLVEIHLQYVAEILRNKAATAQENGEVTIYAIDDEPSPYIKKIEEAYPELLKNIQKMDSREFENICVKILSCLGCDNAECTGGNQDDGVDFYGFGIPNKFNLSIPINSNVFIIGQAKRYKHSNIVKKSELRKFVGGALKKLNDFRKSGRVATLTPVIFAFWTSSDFDIPAKEYAKNMGIWFMNGRTFVEYLKALGLENEI